MEENHRFSGVKFTFKRACRKSSPQKYCLIPNNSLRPVRAIKLRHINPKPCLELRWVRPSAFGFWRWLGTKNPSLKVPTGLKTTMGDDFFKCVYSEFGWEIVFFGKWILSPRRVRWRMSILFPMKTKTPQQKLRCSRHDIFSGNGFSPSLKTPH